MQRRSIALLMTSAVAVAGCGGSAAKPTPVAGTRAADGSQPVNLPVGPKPAVRFLTPANGDVTGASFTVRVELKNFTIDPKAVGQAPRPGRGHLHFSLDGGHFDYPRYSGPNGIVAKGLGVAGDFSPALAPYITYSNIPAGRHTLKVVLANNNHTSTGVQAVESVVVR